MKPSIIYYDEFSKELVKEIKKAKSSITISVMVAYADSDTKIVFDELQKAIKRGVRVQIYLDNYTRSLRSENVKEILKYWLDTKKYLLVLHNNGARVMMGGKVGINPFAKRIHQKIYLIDGTAYFGGVNLCFSEAQDDLMVKVKSQKLVDWFSKWLDDFFSGKRNLPTKFKLNGETTIMMDNRQRAPIYAEFTKLAKKCRYGQISSRMCPSGPAMKFLSSKRIKYYFNPIKKMALPSKVAILWDTFRYKIKNSYTGDKFIHAKCALFDDKTVIISSNNFNYMGVAWHTTEVGLVSTDKSLVNEVKKFFNELN